VTRQMAGKRPNAVKKGDGRTRFAENTACTGGLILPSLCAPFFEKELIYASPQKVSRPRKFRCENGFLKITATGKILPRERG